MGPSPTYHPPEGGGCETSVEHGLPLHAEPAVGYCSRRPRPLPMWGSRFVGARAVGPWVGERKPLGKTPCGATPVQSRPTYLPTAGRVGGRAAGARGQCSICRGQRVGRVAGRRGGDLANECSSEAWGPGRAHVPVYSNAVVQGSGAQCGNSERHQGGPWEVEAATKVEGDNDDAEHRHKPFKLAVKNSMRGRFLRRPRVAQRGLTHVFNMETLDLGLRHQVARQRLALGEATQDRTKRHCMYP